ncbi:Carboxyl/Cholinesterase 18 [Frankliniella occidentalis]|uniref:Carboxylic ester hydrolase n=1 Tax=Frankliniella occidentalis TaxID=133901 RepID=A0A6J1S5B9_FRAOC|nr:venom carboxylesterase-6 [Frankliniella occidentalis]KAE8750498.1 Carboxyl/Cholinesterase 18 [Frankliniella occidentalis]
MTASAAPALAATALAAMLAVGLLAPALAIVAEFPSVTTNNGSFILGQRLKSAGLRGGTAPRDYAAFWGVPYAKPPVGERRFKAPEPSPLPTVVDAKLPAPACLQLDRQPSAIIGSEDCLTLQIFTPNYDPAAALDVIVLIHGGGFMFGRGPRTGLQYIMDYDVVVVNVDYRLGVLGYLSFEDAELPGNAGMLDQVEALRWVQENIVYFGGNNKSVTLAGFSAGSASALMHTLSPLSKGLFHRVLALSGSPLNPWAQQPSALANAKRFAELANCTGANTAAIVSCLQAKNATELVALETHFQGWQQNPFSPFAPVVDSKSKRPFMPDQPARLLENKRGPTDVPLLFSVTSEEGLFPAAEFILNDTLVQELDENWADVAPKLLHLHDNRTGETPSLMHQIREHYFQNASLGHSHKQLVQLISDRDFFAGVNDYVLTAAATQSSPVYMYSFEYRGEFSLTHFLTGGNTSNLGVAHADDFQYFIEFPWSGVMRMPTDLDMRSQLLELWVSFAKSSIPVLRGANWTPQPKTKSDVLHFLKISGPGNVTMVQAKDFGQSAFWKSLQIKENGNNSGRASASLSLSLVSLAILVFCKLS